MKKVLKIMSMVGVIAIMIIVACVSAKFNTKAMNNKSLAQVLYTKYFKILFITINVAILTTNVKKTPPNYW